MVNNIPVVTTTLDIKSTKTDIKTNSKINSEILKYYEHYKETGDWNNEYIRLDLATEINDCFLKILNRPKKAFKRKNI